MSQGFSWSKIIGEGAEAADSSNTTPNTSEAAAPPVASEPPVVSSEPPVTSAPPVAMEPSGDAVSQAKSDEDDLQSILARLKDGAGSSAAPAPAPRFEDIAPGEENTFDTTVDGGVHLDRPMSVPVAPEPATSFDSSASLEEIAAQDVVELESASTPQAAPPIMKPPVAAEPPIVAAKSESEEFAMAAPPVAASASAPSEDPLTKIFGKKKSAESSVPPMATPPPPTPAAPKSANPDDFFEAPNFANAGENTTRYDPSIMEADLGGPASGNIAARELGNVRKASETMRSIVDIHIDEILRLAVERKASDIHLTVGLPPMARVDGDIIPLPYQPLGAEDCRRLLYEILNDERLEKFERTHEADFSYAVKDVGRFRFNMYMQRGVVAASMRAIPTKIPDFETLGLPNIIREMAKRSSGLILVTGPTGSGKSTTIATMIDDINNQRKSHIITIEDPIEYLHTHKQCMVNQREMHSDTYSFHNALRAVLREDPDIILVGELRDLETIEAALTLAETGHLVFGTLHTRNAPSTIDRIIDVFPTDAQAQIRVLLSNTLEGVVSQQLLPLIGGGRCASIEVMVATPAIKNLVREGKTHQMYSILETSSSQGMQTMDAMLAELYRTGKCDWEECVMRAIDKENFSRLAKR